MSQLTTAWEKKKAKERAKAALQKRDVRKVFGARPFGSWVPHGRPTIHRNLIMSRAHLNLWIGGTGMLIPWHIRVP